MKIPKLSVLARGLLYGALGLGVAGNGYYAYQNNLHDDSQTENITELTRELGESQAIIRDLNGFLRNEQATNEHQARQMSSLQTDLSSRITLDQMAHAISSVTPSTVKVEGASGWGSGVIMIGNNGNRYILTNGHVTEGNDIARNEFEDGVYHIKVYSGSDYNKPIEFDAAPVILSNGERAHSTPREHDLTLLLIPPDIELPNNAGVRIRNLEANPLSVGEPVFAVGNPFDKADTVTIGSISHIDRKSNLNQNHHVQTDAAINPGNSGGGLFSIRIVNGNPTVELIGINTWIRYGANNIGGSIRVDEIQNMFNEWGLSL